MALPPGPRAPAVVQLGRWVVQPIPLLRECRARYGDAFTLRLAGVGTYAFFSAPDAIRQLFTGDSDALRSGETLEQFEPLVGPRSVLLLDGPAHLRQRRLLMPPFHGERMQAYAGILGEVADASIDAWPVGRPFALHPHLQAVTLDVILRAVFGMEEGARMRELAGLLSRLVDSAQNPWVLLPVFRVALAGTTPWARFVEIRRRTDAVLYAEIAARRAALALAAQHGGDAAPRNDVLSMLLQARDEDGRPMTDGELRDELITLLIAGHETTASTLAWVFEQLVVQPEIAARAKAELREVVGAGALTPAHLARLDYHDAIAREALRMRPILPLVARRVKQPVEIGGYRLEPGDTAAACIYLAHHRPESWPDPESFRPERFLGWKADPYTWLPFGGGIRRCIGMALALYEIKAVLAATLLRVTFRPAPGREPRTVRRGITFVPAGGARVVLDSRTPRRTAGSVAEAAAAPPG